MLSRFSIRAFLSQLGLVVSLLFIGTFVTGCTQTETNEPLEESECSGHGHIHGFYCHCDPGFSQSEDRLSCLQSQDESDGNDASEDQDEGSDQVDDEGVDLDSSTNEFVFTATQVSAKVGKAQDGTQTLVLEAVDGDTLLKLELYAAFGGPTSPGRVDITQSETNYATCGTCIMMQTGCAPHGDHVHCARTFMPKVGGHVRFDEVGSSAGEHITGALLDVVFQEVTIGEGFQTQPVANAPTQDLSDWEFDVELNAVAQEECSGHGFIHGDQCHCDSGYQLDPTDPMQCIAE